MSELSHHSVVQVKKTIWDYLFFACMAVVAIWLVLKLAGVIQTPVWLEYGVPMGSFFLGFLVFYQGLIDKISTLTATTARTQAQLEHLHRDFESIKKFVNYPTP